MTVNVVLHKEYLYSIAQRRQYGQIAISRSKQPSS